MNELISVIIPIYNSAETLEKCVLSIISQTYKNTEIILINDGSDDGSEKVMTELCGKYPNIRCITQKNSGVSVARNTGLDMAQGEYVVFVDSDDTVNVGFIEKLYEQTANGVLPMCGMRILMDGGNERIDRVYSVDEDVTRLDRRQAAVIYEKHLLSSAGNKLYSRKLIEKNKLRFPADMSNGEDLIFNLEYARFISGFCIINEPLYEYDLKAENTLHTIYDSVRFSYIRLMYARFTALLGELGCNAESFSTVEKLMLDEFLYAVRLYCLSGGDSPLKKMKELRRVFLCSEYTAVEGWLDECVSGRLRCLYKLKSPFLTVMYYLIVKLKNRC